MNGGTEGRSEFLRGPKWRTRTTDGRRATAVAITIVILAALGSAVMLLAIVVLRRLSAPGWVVSLPWVVPTAAMVAWVLLRPGPAILSDDDDDSWSGYAIRFVLVGAGTPRPRVARVSAAVLLGAPIAWTLWVLFLLELTGIV